MKAPRRDYRLELAAVKKYLEDGKTTPQQLHRAIDRLSRRLAGLATVADENDALRRLGLFRATVTVDAVRHAYRRLSKQAHPDTGGSADAFRRLKADRDLAIAIAQKRRGNG